MAADTASLAKKYNISADQVSSLIKGSSTAYGDKVLKNLQKAGKLNPSPAPAPVAPEPMASPDVSASPDSNSNDFTKIYSNIGASTEKMYQNMASQTLAREPLVRQLYSNLSAELDVAKSNEDLQANQTGQQRIGEARASVAGAGLENAQGSFRAPITAQENLRDQTLTQISDKYNVQKETLATQMESDIGSLYDTANKYLIAGNTAMADATKDILSYKIDEAKTQLAQLNSDRDYNLQVDKFNYDKAHPSGGGGLTAAQIIQMQKDADTKKQNWFKTATDAGTPVATPTLGANNTVSRVDYKVGNDAVSPLVYLQYKNKTLDVGQSDLASLLANGSIYDKNVVAPELLKVKNNDQLTAFMNKYPWVFSGDVSNSF